MLQVHENNFLRTAFHSAFSLSVSSLTKKNLPYLIGWVCTFIWLYSYFLPMGGFRFENELYYRNVGDTTPYFYIWLFANCLITVLGDGRKFVPRVFYSVIVTLVSFFVLRITGTGLLSQGIMLITAVCIGHIFASNIYAFFMILNNSEKFHSMLLAVLLPKVLMFIKPVLNRVHSPFDLPSAIILAVIMILAVCSLFYRRGAEEMPRPAKIKTPPKAYTLMPLVFMVLAVNDIIAPASLRQIADFSAQQKESCYFCGIVLGIAAVLLLQKRFAVNICNMLNLSFALLAVGFVVDIISFQTSGTGPAAAVCFGASYAIGIVNIYYLAGFMTKKFQSVTFYRIGIALATLYYFATFSILQLNERIEILPPVFMALVCVCIVVLFFLLSPFFNKMLYEGEWIEDSYRQDVTQCSRLEARLRDDRLTPAEIEVCRLLLKGYTLRQISGIQSKAYATVNTYCTSIYRKLKINSRAELMLLLRDYAEE